MENEKHVILENSTNAHVLKGNAEVVKKIDNMNTMVIDLNGAAIVEHGQHATVRTEDDTKNIIKITQQEFNPVTKALMNACD
jgi:hypothetical protein